MASLLNSLRARRQELFVAADDTYYTIKSAVRRSRSAETLASIATARWSRKAREPFHVLYVGHPEPWERHHLPADPGLRDTISTWWLADHGLSGYRDGVLENRDRVGEALLDAVRDLDRTRPIHLVLAYLSGSHVLARHVEKLRSLGVMTAGFHWDDRLYFRGRRVDGQLSGPAALAREYDLNLTCAFRSLKKYRAVGGRALFWPEAANPAFFRPMDVPRTHDIAFVGARYGARGRVIEELADRGFSVLARGDGWPDGRASTEEIPTIFGRGRVVVGFSGLGRSLRASALKARDFEVPMCGAAYLTSHNPDLALVYDIPAEIGTWRSVGGLATTLRALLDNDVRIEAMRSAALHRARTDHTWTVRVAQIARILGHEWGTSIPGGSSLPSTVCS